MVRLNLTVEGQTEQAFAVKVLAPHLAGYGVFLQNPRLTGPHGRRGGRIPTGGMFNTFGHVLSDVSRWMLEQRKPDVYFSTMIDLYSLPNDFPEFAAASAAPDCRERVRLLEDAWQNHHKDPRFIPYLQLHEFEALLLSDPAEFKSRFENSSAKVRALAEECASRESPELIDDGQHSHPKARIKEQFPDYDENVDGPDLAARIGLEKMRARCPHFNAWLSRLEGLAS